MRRFLPLALVLAALPAPLHAADGDADDKAIRGLTQRFFDAFASKDLDAFMALWSEKSPYYKDCKKTMAGLYRGTGPITVKGLTVVRVRRDAAVAWVRVHVELAANDSKTGEPHPSFGAQDRVLDLRRDGAGWEVTRYESPGWRLIDGLVAAKTKEERLRLLDDDSDLVGPELVWRLLEEGVAKSEYGGFDLAGQLQDAAQEVAEGLGDAGALASCHLRRGQCLAMQARYELALSNLDQALRLYRAANNRRGEAAAHVSIGVVCDETGRYAEALQNYQEAYRTNHDLGDLRGEMATLSDIGVVNSDTGQYVDALKNYFAALKVSRELQDGQGQAKILNNIGNVYQYTSRYADALENYQDGLKICRDIRDPRMSAITLNNIGAVYGKIGCYEEALHNVLEARNINHGLGDWGSEAGNLHNIGVFYMENSRYAEAIQTYQESLRIIRVLGDQQRESETLCNIGNVYEKRGWYEKALEQYQECLAIQRKLKARKAEQVTLNNIGAAYMIMDKKHYAEARQHLVAALDIAEALGDQDTAGSCNANLGYTYQAQGQWGEAVRAFGEAIRVTELLRTNTREPSLQTSLLSQKIDPFFRLAQCQLELKQPDKALAAAEGMKARSLMDILRGGKADLRRGMSDDEKQTEQKLQDKMTALGVQVEDPRGKADGAKRKGLIDDLDRARQNLDAFRRDLYLHRPDLATRRAEFAPASLPDLGNAFTGRPGLVVLSYLVGAKETLLFVLTDAEKDGGPARLTVHRIDVASKDLAEAVDAFLSACADPSKGEPDAADLYRWLIAPAVDPLADAKQLIIIPDDVLHVLPFQALKDPDGKYLIERFAVSYAPSVTALTKMEALGAQRRKEYAGRPPSLLAVGVSAFGPREKPLPAAEREAKAVVDAFGEGAKLLSGAEATRAKLVASWSGRRYLHFATHGRLNSDAPLYSALVLSSSGDGDEGVLYARDLVNADVPAELAVMSACQTGLGKQVNGEGLQGLSWSWFTAGVPSTVASQWSVGDDSTGRLMKVFYARLKAGDSKAEALRQAELSLLQNDATRHPFYWAPFVLVGDDR